MRRLKQNGFTLIELLVVAPVLMVTIVVMMSYLFNQYGLLTKEGAQLRLKTEAQLVTLSLQDDVFYATAFTQDLNTNLVDANAPSGGWKYNTTPQTLIISTPALTKSHRDSNREPVYINTLGCDDSVKAENVELDNNAIYFVSGTNLYKRTVTAPSNLSTCGTSFVKTSCPLSQVTASCPEDRTMTTKLKTFSVTYYKTDNTTTTDPEQADRVKITVTLEDTAFGENVSASATITLKKLNQ